MHPPANRTTMKYIEYNEIVDSVEQRLMSTTLAYRSITKAYTAEVKSQLIGWEKLWLM